MGLRAPPVYPSAYSPIFFYQTSQCSHSLRTALRRHPPCVFPPSMCRTSRMDAASNSQVFPDDPQPHSHHRPLSLATSLSLTLVNDAHNTERPSLKLRMPCGASNILNAAVINSAGQSLYLMLGNSKCTKLVSCRNNIEVAIIQWDRHSPRMVFHHKKMKCKE